MSSIFTPSNQIKLTNVSVVRLKKGGKRFELACYKNKVIDYRNKITKDLDEVLQIQTIFLNVSKGQVAKKDELLKAFNTEDQKSIVLEILNKGELQVSTKERELQSGNLRKDIASIVAEKCIHPVTKRPYTASMIEKAMNDLHISINTDANAKQQALEVIKQLEKNKSIPITRAQMRIKIQTSVQDAKKVKEAVKSLVSQIVEEKHPVNCTEGQVSEDEEDVEMECLIEPGKFKAITEMVQDLTKGKGTVYTVNLKETKD